MSYIGRVDLIFFLNQNNIILTMFFLINNELEVEF